MVDYVKLREDIYRGRANEVEAGAKAALEAGAVPEEILSEGLIAGMAVVGKDFKDNKIYVPEVLIAARAMKAAMTVLRPLLAERGAKPLATLVIGTVKGDLHDIGKNLVSMMMEGAGVNVVDLGVDVKPDDFVEAVRDNKADLIGMSALLTTTMVNMKEIVDAVKDSGVSAKTLIGGAPVTQSFAEEIGADGYAPDAASAVETAREILGL